MSGILTTARFVYGDDTCRLIFEPLVADWQRDVAHSRSLVLRARWWAALAASMVAALPRATFGKLPAAFVINVGALSAGFFLFAFALQWLFGTLLGSRGGAESWPPSFASTVPFLMIPLAWAVRMAAIPQHQQRLLAAAFTVACATGAWMTSPVVLSARIAIAVAPALLAWSGWKLHDARMRPVLPIGQWPAGFYSACGIIIASAPIKLALGVGVFGSWWPGDDLIPYIMGLMIALTVARLPDRQASNSSS